MGGDQSLANKYGINSPSPESFHILSSFDAALADYYFLSGNKGSQVPGCIDVNGEAIEVSVIDSNQISIGLDCKLKLFFVMSFQQNFKLL